MPNLRLGKEKLMMAQASSPAFMDKATVSEGRGHEVRHSRNSAVCCEKGSRGWGATAGGRGPRLIAGQRRAPKGNDLEARIRRMCGD